MYRVLWELLHVHVCCNACTLVTYFPPHRKRRHDSEGDYLAPPTKSAHLLSTEVEELSGIYYRPRTKETKSTYEILLNFILQAIGDQVLLHKTLRGDRVVSASG